MTTKFDGEEYAVDSYPDGTHIDTVLAYGFYDAVVEALHPDTATTISDFNMFTVHHMPTGEEQKVELTPELHSRIQEKAEQE